MDARKITLVQQSYEMVAVLGLKAAEIFYAELFAIDPSLRAMFKSDIHEQHKKLFSALTFVVRSLHTPEKIVGTLEKLAVKHLDYGVKPEHYTCVGNALLRTLKKGLGPEFSPEVSDAWVDAFRMIVQIMKKAAYGSVQSGVRGAA
jgi:hemoglobin-like flavoprotein